MKKLVQFLFLIFLSIELGLRARSIFEPHNNTSTPGAKKILIIGDSVLGSPTQSGTISFEFQKKIRSRSTHPVELINGVAGANSSADAWNRLNEPTAFQRPDLAIIMLGNSDYLSATKHAAQPSSLIRLSSYLSHVQVYRLLLALESRLSRAFYQLYNPLLYHDVIPKSLNRATVLKRIQNLEQKDQAKSITCQETVELAKLKSKLLSTDYDHYLGKSISCINKLPSRNSRSELLARVGDIQLEMGSEPLGLSNLQRSFELDPLNPNPLLIQGWFHYGQGHCSAAINKFESAAMLSNPHRRMLIALKDCYFREKMYDHGIHFLKTIAQKGIENQPLAQAIANNLELEANSTISSQPYNPIYRRDRDQFISQLYYYKKKHLPLEANKIFLQREDIDILTENQIDIKNYRAVIRLLVDQGAKIVVLQYPNLADWPVKAAVAPFYSKVKFISLGELFEKHLDEINITDLFEDDFTHVNELGATLIAEELSLQAVEQLGL